MGLLEYLTIAAGMALVLVGCYGLLLPKLPSLKESLHRLLGRGGPSEQDDLDDPYGDLAAFRSEFSFSPTDAFAPNRPGGSRLAAPVTVEAPPAAAEAATGFPPTITVTSPRPEAIEAEEEDASPIVEPNLEAEATPLPEQNSLTDELLSFFDEEADVHRLAPAIHESIDRVGIDELLAEARQVRDLIAARPRSR